MKTVNKTLLFIFLSFLFVSCGDEEKPVSSAPIQRKITQEYVYKVPIRGFSGRLGIENKFNSIRLADIIGEEAARNIVSADLQQAASYLEVKGLKKLEQAPTLKDFNIQIEENPAINFSGDCTPSSDLLATEFESDMRQSTPKVTDFIKAILDTYMRSNNKSAHLILSFAPTKDIFVTDSVNLEITITADYIYNTY
jgi:hypothetical protein